MTDEQIIKALECCASADDGCSTDCPLFAGGDSCFTTLLKPMLNLINRQKAEKEALIAGQETLQKHIAEQKSEIEMLNGYINTNCIDCAGCKQWKCDCSNIKAEAIKEFAERLKTKASDFEFGKAVWVVYIDNLVKEMVGDGDG
jgi:hypothetical protein